MSGLRGLIDRVRGLFGAPPEIDSPQAFGYADLRGGGSRIAIIPQLGGRISALELGGREWLSPSGRAGAPSAEAPHALFGAFEECFPTSAACTIPGWVLRFGGSTFPERGELTGQRPQFAVQTANGPTTVTTWRGERMPYVLTRTARVSNNGTITLDYRVVNAGKEPIPFIWSAQPLFPLSAKTRIVLPEGTLVRVGMQERIDLGGSAREQRWPRLRMGDRLVDMSRPHGISSRFACKLFMEMPREPVAIEEVGLRFEISADPAQVPNLGIWINRGGLPAAGRLRAPHTVGLHPSIGAPDSLADALGDWKSAHWIAPEESRDWRLTLRARALTGELPATQEASTAAPRSP